MAMRFTTSIAKAALFLACAFGMMAQGEPAAPSASPEAVAAPTPATEKKKEEAKPAATTPEQEKKAAAPVAAPLPKGSGKVRDGDFTDKVVVIPVGKETLMNPARFEFMSRTLQRATEEGAEAVIFNMDTPGGIAWDTTTVIMQDLQKLTVPSYSYVNPRAVSAGAIIAMGTDIIYMSPASSIGAATPVMSGGGEMGDDERAKMNAAMMGMARSAAKAKGHNPAISDAMIDKDVGLKVGDEEIVPKGQICMLDQEQATKLYNGKPLLAKGIAKDMAELRQKENLKGEVVTAEAKGFEYIAILITDYAAILILVGLAAGYLEMQHPGFGLPGIIAGIAFGLFFFGHYVAGSLVGYEAVTFFVIGILLILIEIFILPGHFIAGAIGLLLMVGSLIYAMASWDITVPEGKSVPVDFAYYLTPLKHMGIAFAGAIAVILVLMRFLPRRGPFSKLVLQTAVGGAQASIEGVAQSQAAAVSVGDTGFARSAMRPYGEVTLGSITLEAMVEGDYLPPQTPIRVRSVQSGRVVVERA